MEYPGMIQETVWKYEISPGRSTLRVPKDPTFLACRDGYMWLQVNSDPDCETEELTFEVIPTGGKVPLMSKHLGTFFIDSAAFGKTLVFHLYEVDPTIVHVEGA